MRRRRTATRCAESTGPTHEGEAAGPGSRARRADGAPPGPLLCCSLSASGSRLSRGSGAPGPAAPQSIAVSSARGPRVRSPLSPHGLGATTGQPRDPHLPGIQLRSRRPCAHTRRPAQAKIKSRRGEAGRGVPKWRAACAPAESSQVGSRRGSQSSRDKSSRGEARVPLGRDKSSRGEARISRVTSRACSSPVKPSQAAASDIPHRGRAGGRRAAEARTALRAALLPLSLGPGLVTESRVRGIHGPAAPHPIAVASVAALGADRLPISRGPGS